MKKFLLLTLIYLAASIDTLLEEKQGPAYNAKNGGYISCIDRNVLNGTDWLDDSPDAAFVPSGVSDCVDLQLWDPYKEIYYDHCCYIRFQQDGKMHAGCIGLSEENYLDTTVTIDRLEKGDRALWTTSLANSKIYQLDCYSSNLKSLSIASILLIALFF